MGQGPARGAMTQQSSTHLRSHFAGRQKSQMLHAQAVAGLGKLNAILSVRMVVTLPTGDSNQDLHIICFRFFKDDADLSECHVAKTSIRIILGTSLIASFFKVMAAVMFLPGQAWHCPVCHVRQTRHSAMSTPPEKTASGTGIATLFGIWFHASERQHNSGQHDAAFMLHVIAGACQAAADDILAGNPACGS